jgi:hypothetical protein
MPESVAGTRDLLVKKEKSSLLDEFSQNQWENGLIYALLDAFSQKVHAKAKIFAKCCGNQLNYFLMCIDLEFKVKHCFINNIDGGVFLG